MYFLIKLFNVAKITDLKNYLKIEDHIILSWKYYFKIYVYWKKKKLFTVPSLNPAITNLLVGETAKDVTCASKSKTKSSNSSDDFESWNFDFLGWWL